MIDLIYLFNREGTLLEILSKNDFDNLNCKKQLNGSMEMSFTTKSKNNIKRFNKVGVFIDDEFQLFYIDDFNDFKSLEQNEIETICLADFYNLSNTIIEDKRIINGPINTAITKALEETDYKVGVVETFENKDINFYFINSLEALNKIISTYNCEFNARYILNEDNTISKFIDLRHRLGIDTGLRFTYDTVLENVEKSPINEGLFNVLYGRGKSLETEDGGFSRKLDFAEVNNGKKYVEDLDSIKKYGRLEGIYENNNIEDKNILLEKTKERLEEVKYQKFNYKATVKDITKILGLEHFKVELGDSIIILDEEINDIVEARIIEIDINSDEVFLTLGHYQKGLIDEDLENKFDNIKDSLDKIENEKIDDSKYPNTLPKAPVLEGKGLFATVDLSWTFENKSYYTYEVYASKQKDFNPSIFNRIFEGKASSLLHEVKPSQTWYYRCRAKNTHGNYTDFSNQVEAHTLKLSDAAEYFEEAAIGHALIKDLDADKITVGTLKGNRIDARNINVTDGNGKKTLAIDSFGNVTLLPTNFKILVEGKEESVISQSSFNIALDKINLSIKTVEEKTTETNKSLIVLGDTMNGAFKDGVLDEAEKQSIKNNLSALNAEKQNFIAQADGILKNSELLNTAESIKINDAKANFINTHYKLINKINLILGKVEVDNMRIHFIDTQVSGDCILIQYNNKNILVDSNEAECSDKIIKYLKNLGVSNLDYIIATHHHSDHSGAFPAIIQEFSTDGCVAYHRTPDWSKMPAIETQWDTKGCHDRFINACNLKGISIKTPTENERIVLSSDTYIEFYNTTNTDYNNYNNLSICILVVHKNKKYFLSGDIYIEGQAKLASSLSKVDIYKSQHHDYDEKMNDTYFNKLNPTECVMTLFTIHGDERPKSLSGRCQYNNIPYYYTHGTLILESDGTNYTLSTSNNYLYKDKWWNKDNTGNWYYFKYNGDYAKNESIEIDGTLYNFNSTGLCTNPNGRA